MSRSGLGVAFLAAWATGALPAAADSPTLASVMEIHGPWTADGRSLVTGARLSPGAVVTTEAGAVADPRDPWYIHIALDDSEALDCADAATCPLPLRLPGASKATSAGALTGAILREFSKNVVIFVGARVRSATLGPVLKDAVLSSASPILLSGIWGDAAAPAQKYSVRLRGIDPSRDPVADEVVPLTIENGVAQIAPAHVPSGLYELSLLDAGNAEIVSCWVAFVPPGRQAAAASAYAVAGAEAQRLATAGDPEEARRFARAGLAYIASREQ